MDALDKIASLMAEAVADRDQLIQQANAAKLEAHQSRRKLQHAQNTIDRLNTVIQQLEQRTIVAEQVADQHRRALSDHAART